MSCNVLSLIIRKCSSINLRKHKEIFLPCFQVCIYFSFTGKSNNLEQRGKNCWNHGQYSHMQKEKKTLIQIKMLALVRNTFHSEYWEEAEYCTIEGGSGYMVVGVCKYSLLNASIGSKDWDLRNTEI